MSLTEDQRQAFAQQKALLPTEAERDVFGFGGVGALLGVDPRACPHGPGVLRTAWLQGHALITRSGQHVEKGNGTAP
jgi:hypothetical protein